jgi:hypothetical protein
MPSGGKRPGAGRPRGSKAKKSQAIAIAAMAAGITPLEFMLRIMRDEAVDPLIRMDMAKASAPYMHARLASTEVSGPGGDALVPILNVQIMRFADPDGNMSAGPPKLIEHR